MIEIGAGNVGRVFKKLIENMYYGTKINLYFNPSSINFLKSSYMFHEMLRMNFSDSKLVNTSKRQGSILETPTNSNEDDTYVR